MATKKKEASKKSRHSAQPGESRASEALTVAWTVTVTTLLFCNLAVIAVHYLQLGDPDAKKMSLLREMLLLASAIVGFLSLVLLPFVYRYRRTPPPTGLAVFGVCLAIAPILVIVLRSMGG